MENAKIHVEATAGDIILNFEGTGKDLMFLLTHAICGLSREAKIPTDYMLNKLSLSVKAYKEAEKMTKNEA